MRITKVICSCGASAEWTDTKGVYTKGRYEPGENFKYLIDEQADKWIEVHKECIKKTVTFSP